MDVGKVLVAVIAGLLVGCVDAPVQPTAARPAAVSASRASSAAAPYVVEFNGDMREDFAARVAALGGSVDYVAESAGFAGVRGLTAAAAATLGRQTGIAAVYEDTELQLGSRAVLGDMSTAIGPTSVANPAASFLFAFQWNMRAINAPAAWAAGNLGSANVTAAILDSGIDYDGYDMAGIVDLARSTSLVPSDDAFIAANAPGRNAIDDLNGHGTNVATQVSSKGTIFAGVNSKARLIAIKAFGRTGVGTTGGVLAGLIWAADHGADVTNMSLGAPTGVDKPANRLFVALTNRVFNYAHRAGMVVVVSAGNNATNMDNLGRAFFAYCEAPHVVCVGATGPTASKDPVASPFSGPWTNVDALAPYSNFGRQDVTVTAPGGSTFGYVSSVCPRRLAVVSPAGVVSFPCNVPPGFFLPIGVIGTSQAAPHVTGVVAQLIAKYGKRNPAQIKQLLLRGVDDLGAPGPDATYGAGRVNLAKALGL